MGSLTLSNSERQYLFSEMMTLFQNGYYRNQEPVLLPSILTALQSTQVTLTEQQSRYIQWFLNDRKDVLTRLTNPRLQHILQGQNTQGFGAGGSGGPPNSPGAPGVGGTSGSYHYFNSSKQYVLCVSLIRKLKGVGS